MFDRFQVTIRFKNRVVGGLPKNADLIAGWLASKKNLPKSAEELAAETVAKVAGSHPDDEAEGMWTTFASDEQGLYLEGRCFKAMLKEAANILRPMLCLNGPTNAAYKDRVKRFTNYRSKLAERLFVEDDRIRVGVGVTTPDGTEERPIHVMTARGPRTALKRFDYLNAPRDVSFVVRLLQDGGLVDLPVLKILLEYAGQNGFGADRSQGNGTFDVVSVEPVE